MKAAFLLHAFPRLHNTFIQNEIVGLLELGVDVSVFSLDRPADVLVNQDVTRYRLLERTVYFDSFPAAATEVPPECEPYMAPFRRKPPARWHFLIRGQLRPPPQRVYPFEAVAEQLVADRYDIIHGAFGNRPATAAMILSKMTGIPWTFETHAYDLFVDFPYASAKIESASAIITESAYHRAYLEKQLGAPPDKVQVIHLSPNRRMLDGIGHLERRDDLIVSVCRLHPIKGLSYGLRAVASIRDEFPGLQYTIIGGGPLANALAREARRLRVDDCVHFAGDLTNDEACRLVRQAAVFLLPSVIAGDGDRDGTPTAIAEAMQLEVPVVSSRISGIPELVHDGVTGLLTRPGDVGEIAAALRRLLRDPGLRERMGRAGRRKVLDEFNVDTNAAALLACWSGVLGEDTPPAAVRLAASAES